MQLSTLKSWYFTLKHLELGKVQYKLSYRIDQARFIYVVPIISVEKVNYVS